MKLKKLLIYCSITAIAIIMVVEFIKLFLCRREPEVTFMYNQTNGPLGEPVGKVINVVLKKTKDSSAKGQARLVEVLSINGKSTESIKMKYEFFGGANKTLKDENTYECTVYQSGGFYGFPSGLPNETIENYAFQTREFAFEFFLVICSEKQTP